MPITVVVLLAHGSSPLKADLSSARAQIWGQFSNSLQGAPEERDSFGKVLAAGDFNGDGRKDLAIGTPGESVNGNFNAGAVSVLYGAVGGLDAVGNDIWSQDTSGVEGVPESTDRFGAALAVGDFNHDGYDDLAVGVPGDEDDHGAVNVLYGTVLGLVAGRIWMQGSGIKGVAEYGDLFGFALAAGDFDGDLFDDLAIGVPGENTGAGAVNVLYGSSDRLRSFNDQIWAHDTPGVKGSAAELKRFGRALAAGDFDHDGFSDLAFGSPFPLVITPNGAFITGPGEVNVLHGSGAGLGDLDDQLWDQGSPGVQGNPGEHRLFGWALAAGDLNGDGFDDLAIGVPRYPEANGSLGVVNVLYGSEAGLRVLGITLWSQDSPSVLGAGESSDSANLYENGFNTGFGSALAIGDFDADEADDLAIGTPGEDLDGVIDAGVVNVLYGTLFGLTSVSNQLWSQSSAGVQGQPEYRDYFGEALAAGDFDGDGRADLAIGVPDENFEGTPGRSGERDLRIMN